MITLKKTLIIGLLVILTGCLPGFGSGDFPSQNPQTNQTTTNTSSNQIISLATAQNSSGASGTQLATNISTAFQLFQPAQTFPAWTDNGTNWSQGATVSAIGVKSNYSLGAYVDPNDSNKKKFFVVDRGNHRLLIFNSIPTNNGAIPDVVVGQPNFILGGAANMNYGTPGIVSARGLNDLTEVAVCSNGTMFITDQGNNRILAYKKIPLTNGASADYVLGQPDFTSSMVNNPVVGSNSYMNHPYVATCIGTKLFVIDRGNNRILVYNSIPVPLQGQVTTSGADFVIGQPNFDTTSVGNCDYSSDDSYLNTPYEIGTANGVLFVVDGANNRILVYNTIPVSNFEKPDFVVGQPNSATCLANVTGTATPTVQSLDLPNSIAFRSNLMAVADYTNSRIMFFGLPIVQNEPSALYELGKPDFITGGVSATSATSILTPKGLIFDSNFLWIGDGGNNRVLTIALPF